MLFSSKMRMFSNRKKAETHDSREFIEIGHRGLYNETEV